MPYCHLSRRAEATLFVMKVPHSLYQIQVQTAIATFSL